MARESRLGMESQSWISMLSLKTKVGAGNPNPIFSRDSRLHGSLTWHRLETSELVHTLQFPADGLKLATNLGASSGRIDHYRWKRCPHRAVRVSSH